MKKLLLLCLFIAANLNSFAQVHTDQNGIKTSVTSGLPADGLQAKRYEVATVSYNSHHWQSGGSIVIELFEQFFETGYEKYVLENGFGQGVNSGNAVLKLVESRGGSHYSKVALGTPYDLSSSYGGYTDRALPIFVDVRYYAIYKVKITYLQEKVDVLNNQNQIKINTTPTGVSIADFSTPGIPDQNVSTSGNLQISGNGTHYIANGNVAIGTTNAQGYKLAVGGNMIAESVKVKLQGAWPDFVFAKNYHLTSLKDTEKHILANGHLPGIPSASEVSKDGIELGEMNKKLLQKIEELTLYLIEMKKENESEKLENQKLRDKVAQHDKEIKSLIKH